MVADPRVETNAFDDLARIEAAQLSIRVEFVEKSDAQGEVGVGEQFDRFGFGRIGKQNGHVLFNGSFEQQVGEDPCPLGLFADDDA